jgi:hypothetical protein
MLSNSQHWTDVKAYTKHTKHQKNSSVSTSLRRPDVGKRHSSWGALCRQSFHQWETKIWGENTAETQQQIWFDMVCMASILQTWWVFELYRVLKTMFEPFEGFKVQGIPRTCIMYHVLKDAMQEFNAGRVSRLGSGQWANRAHRRTVLSYNLNESHIRSVYKLFTEVLWMSAENAENRKKKCQNDPKCFFPWVTGPSFQDWFSTKSLWE